MHQLPRKCVFLESRSPTHHYGGSFKFQLTAIDLLVFQISIDSDWKGFVIISNHHCLYSSKVNLPVIFLIMESSFESQKRKALEAASAHWESVEVTVYGVSQSNASWNSPLPSNPRCANLWDFYPVPWFDIPSVNHTVSAFQFCPNGAWVLTTN